MHNDIYVQALKGPKLKWEAVVELSYKYPIPIVSGAEYQGGLDTYTQAFQNRLK